VDVCSDSSCSNILSSWTHCTAASLCTITTSGTTFAYTWTLLPANARYVRWTDGGKDSEYWAAQFGPSFKAASLVLTCRCSAGTYLSSSNCVTCTAGSYCSGQANIYSCPSGQYYSCF
jgi:hypothetical protein